MSTSDITPEIEALELIQGGARSSRKYRGRGKYVNGKFVSRPIMRRSAYQKAVDEAAQLAISRGSTVACKYYHGKNNCNNQSGCVYRRSSRKGGRGSCATKAGTTRSLTGYQDYASELVAPMPSNYGTPEYEEMVKKSRAPLNWDNLGGGKGRRSGSHKAAQRKAKKLCVKASGSTSRVRANIKKAKKSASATKKRCNSKVNKARKASRKASRKAH